MTSSATTVGDLAGTGENTMTTTIAQMLDQIEAVAASLAAEVRPAHVNYISKKDAADCLMRIIADAKAIVPPDGQPESVRVLGVGVDNPWVPNIDAFAALMRRVADLESHVFGDTVKS